MFCAFCFFPWRIPSAVLLLRDGSGWERPTAIFFKFIYKTGCASALSRDSAFLRTGYYNPTDRESERTLFREMDGAFPGPSMSSSRVLGAANYRSDAMFGKEPQSTHDSTEYSDLHSYLLSLGKFHLSAPTSAAGSVRALGWVCHRRIKRN